jgi:outer membrane protein
MKTYQIIYRTLTLCWITLLIAGPVFAQDHPETKTMTLQDVFDLALQNSTQLKIAKKGSDLARQQTLIEKNKRLPLVSTELNYGYLSDANIWNPSFSIHETRPMPHHLTQFSTTASQLISSGNAVNNTIKKSTLEEEVALLSQDKSTTDIKFQVAANYLDIYRLINLRRVYQSNLKLAENRLRNILAMQKQGMVTQNDVLRTELSISDLKLSIRTTDNNINIVNRQMNTVIGLPDSARLVPDSVFLANYVHNNPYETFRDQAYQSNPELKIAATENRIAETNIKLLKSEKLPVVALFAANNFQRPFLNSLPAIDVYYNVWQAGIGIRYNISSIYQSPRKITAGKIALQQSQQKEILQRQNLDVAISTYYTKYIEAQEDLQTYKSDLKSAQENYRIVEKKYFNQLALLTDMIDAANIKLEAETKVTDAAINVVFTYCQLLNSIGNL